MKWCAGPCGRELPLSEFYIHPEGWPQGRCRACHRVAMRDNYRRRYRNQPAFARRERARGRAKYWANVEWERARKQSAGPVLVLQGGK
jgi:hypothetical protein